MCGSLPDIRVSGRQAVLEISNQCIFNELEIKRRAVWASDGHPSPTDIRPQIGFFNKSGMCVNVEAFRHILFRYTPFWQK